MLPLFTASPDRGLEPVDQLPGLTVAPQGQAMTFSLDVPRVLQANSASLYLVKAMGNATFDGTYDVDVAYQAPAGTDVQKKAAVCISVDMMAHDSAYDYLLERAIGHADARPSKENQHRGGGSGHGNAGPTEAVVALFGERFTHSDRVHVRMEAGDFALVMSTISQITPLQVAQPGNHWFANWTTQGPVQVIRIPPAPILCAEGFGEFTGGTHLDGQVTTYTAGARAEVEGLYGTVALIDRPESPYDSPSNQATVHVLDRSCTARAGAGVSLADELAGPASIEVQQWTGTPFLVLAGMGPDLAAFATMGGSACPS
jgi:hypothetical protein